MSPNNRTQQQSPSSIDSSSFFLTGLALDDGISNELQFQQEKSKLKAQTSILLKIKDEFNRTQKLEIIKQRLERAQLQIKQFVKQRQRGEGSLLNNKNRDAKIVQIKGKLEREQQIKVEKQLERLQRKTDKAEKRLKELEQLRQEEVKQREEQERRRRKMQQLFIAERDEMEVMETLNLMSSLEIRFSNTEERAKQVKEEKVLHLQEINENALSRKDKVNENKTSQWQDIIIQFTEKEIKLQKRMQSL